MVLGVVAVIGLDIKWHVHIVETQKKVNKKVVLCIYEQKA